jgi:hypothetical protein
MRWRGGALTLDQFAAQAPAAFCDAWVRCGLAADSATCLQGKGPYDFGQMRADVASGKGRFDASAAAACLAEQRAMSCKKSEEDVSLDAPCGRVLVGTVAVGGACSELEQCAPGTFCNANCSDTCCTGTCAPRSTDFFKKVGEACMITVSDACEPSAYCKGTDPAVMGVCAPRLAAGQTCQQVPPAADPGCLAPGYDCVDGICAKYAEHGAPCRMGECDDYRDVCDGTKTCVSWAQVGQPCNVGCSPQFAMCDQLTNTCVAVPTGGCTTNSDCSFNAVCTAGTCTWVVCP